MTNASTNSSNKNLTRASIKRRNKTLNKSSSSVSLGGKPTYKSGKLRAEEGKYASSTKAKRQVARNGDGSIIFDAISDENKVENESTPLIGQGKSIQFDLTAKMYKRRGGLGWNADNKWVLRYFTLYGSVLCYHDSSNEQDADPSRPRNRINLAKEEIYIKKKNKPKFGAPHNNLIVIYIMVPLGGKRKWEICCDGPEQQQTWYQALLPFQGKSEHGGGSPVNRLRTYSSMESKIYDDMINIGAVTDDDADDDDENLESSSTSFHSSSKEKKTVSARSFSQSHLTSNSRDDVTSISLLYAAFSRRGKRDKHVLVSFGVLNAAAVNIKCGSGSLFSFWLSMLLINLIVSYLCAYLDSKKKSDSAATGMLSLRNNGVEVDQVIEEDEECQKKDLSQHDVISSHRLQHLADPPKPLPTKSQKNLIVPGSTFTRAPALSSTVKELIETDGLASLTTMEACGQATTPDIDFSTTHHSYWNVDSSLFNLRVGPNYKRLKRKAPSGPALYNIYALDLVKKRDSCLHSVKDTFQLPHIPGITDRPTGHPFVKPMIIVALNCPLEEPGLFNSSQDGSSYVCVVYLVVTERTRKELQDLDNASPAVKLLAHWCEHADKDPVCSGRFKIIGQMDDIDNLGLPGFIAGYNGKPALCTKSGKMTRYENHIEFRVNVHMWAYIAKKGLHSLGPRFSTLRINLGFTIEGRSDEEQPETLLGGVKVMNLNLDKITFLSS